MKSQLADAARRSLSEDVERMTPEQRLAAFLVHCQLMAGHGNRVDLLVGLRGMDRFGGNTVKAVEFLIGTVD